MLSTINETITRLFIRIRDERGQALAEYGLVIALVAIACVAALGVLALAISGLMDDVASALGQAGS